MSQVFHFAKIVLAVVFVIGGTAALYFQPALATPLFVGSIAWTQIPE